MCHTFFVTDTLSYSKEIISSHFYLRHVWLFVNTETLNCEFLSQEYFQNRFSLHIYNELHWNSEILVLSLRLMNRKYFRQRFHYFRWSRKQLLRISNFLFPIIIQTIHLKKCKNKLILIRSTFKYHFS